MTIVAQVLDNTAISAAQAQADAIRASAVPTIGSGQFVYFAAFDGTNNDRGAIYKSGKSAFDQRRCSGTQIKDANHRGGNVASAYFGTRFEAMGENFVKVMGVVRTAVGLAGLLCALQLGCAAQARPVDFTPEERLQYTDAVRQHKRVELPLVAHSAGAAGWLDADRIVYSTWEITGVWKAAPDEFAKVVVFDLRTRTVAETQYRGNLLCFSPGRMVISQPTTPSRGGFTEGMGDRLLAGRFGETLALVADVRARLLVPAGCALTPIPEADQKDAVIEVPLPGGDGMLRVPRLGKLTTTTGQRAAYELVDAQGGSVRSFDGDGFPRARGIYSVPWLGAYFSDKDSSAPSELIWPDGRRRVIQPPRLLASFGVANNVGSSIAAPSRVGVLWDLVPWRSYWRMQGIYLLDENGSLRRVDDGYVPAQPRFAVSDDGCRVFYMRREGDPFNADVPFVPIVVDLCETHVTQRLVTGEGAYSAEEYRSDSAGCTFNRTF